MNIKKISILALVVVVLGVAIFLVFNKQPKPDNQEQIVLTQVVNISKKYVALRYRTDNALINAREYSGYEAWNSDMSDIIKQWERLADDADVLEGLGNEMATKKVSLKLIAPVLAYNKQEISDVFDKAPAGKKIATLAKFLGVDAKKAFQILKQDQAQVEADAWNEAGDTLQTLESSATVIKDGCKVATFVGTIALTGGTAAIVSGGTLGQVAVVVSGADLVLEVSDDSAKIALGNNNKISEIIGDVRVVTEPASAILMVATLPQNLTKGIDKLNAIAFGADQFNSSVQDGKAIGIKFPAFTSSSEIGNKNPEVAVLNSEEIKTWLKDQGVENNETTKEEIENILEIGQVANTENSGDKSEPVKINDKMVAENVNVVSDSSLDGVWEGLLKYTPSANADELEMDYLLVLNGDGTIDPQGNGENFSRWVREGNSIKLFMKEEVTAYFEFSLSGDTLNFVKLSGPNSEGKWQDDFAGEDFFGGKFYQISLKKQ